MGTHVRVRREDRETDRDLGVNVGIILHDDIPDKSASGNHLDLMFPQFNQIVHSINSVKHSRPYWPDLRQHILSSPEKLTFSLE